MREIPLTQGQVALVDDEDYNAVAQFKWCACWKKATRSFYAERSLPRLPDGRRPRVMMHRYIMNLREGDRRQIDHKNHDTLDNRRENLCVTTSRGNNQNRRNHGELGPGIQFRPRNSKRPYEARARLDGKYAYLGCFATVREARVAYEEATTCR